MRNNKKATIARYTYYRCSGHKGKCGESYTREEELDRLFKAIVDEVCIPETARDWMIKALRISRAEEKQQHEMAVTRYQNRIDRLQQRLDRMELKRQCVMLDMAVFKMLAF